MFRRLTTVAALLAAVVAGSMVAAQPAQSASVTPISGSAFRISTTYASHASLNTALAARLPVVRVHDVMNAANHSRTSLPSTFRPAGLIGGFRFDSGDNGDSCSYPQGITTSRDAVGTADNGRYDGRQVVVVSWYTQNACSDGATDRSRLTLVDWDANHPNAYRKVLLVEPSGTTSAPSFKDIPVHAGGVTWYGNHLYVADTSRGMRVFDMRRFLKVSSGGTAAQVGRQPSGAYYAHNYAYVLPQVGRVSASAAPGTTPLNWSTISLDRTDRSIIATEFTCSSCTSYPRRAPRAVRFRFATGSTLLPSSATANQALRLPWYGLNGVASHHRRWWFASSTYDRLHYWTPAGGAKSFGWVDGAESLSYWEDTSGPDLIWSLTEKTGARNVLAVTQATYD